MLVDFGIAKSFQVGQKGTMIGTEGYSPPEQYRGEAGPLADIYALGATLHHALTRRDPRLEPPFSFGERPLRKINPAVSVELEAVINTALQYNAGDRFQSAVAMKEALVAAGRKTGILDRIGTTTTSIPSPGGIKPIWSFQCEDEIRGAPLFYDGTVYVGSYDHNLYSINAADGTLKWKFATDGGVVTRPAVFEENIYIGSEDKLLYVVSTRTGKIVWTYYTEGCVRSSPRIAEGHVFFGSDDHHIHAVNLTSGRAVWRVRNCCTSAFHALRDSGYGLCWLRKRGFLLLWISVVKSNGTLGLNWLLHLRRGSGRGSFIFHHLMVHYTHSMRALVGSFGVFAWEKARSLHHVWRME